MFISLPGQHSSCHMCDTICEPDIFYFTDVKPAVTKLVTSLFDTIVEYQKQPRKYMGIFF